MDSSQEVSYIPNTLYQHHPSHQPPPPTRSSFSSLVLDFYSNLVLLLCVRQVVVLRTVLLLGGQLFQYAHFCLLSTALRTTLPSLSSCPGDAPMDSRFGIQPVYRHLPQNPCSGNKWLILLWCVTDVLDLLQQRRPTNLKIPMTFTGFGHSLFVAFFRGIINRIDAAIMGGLERLLAVPTKPSFQTFLYPTVKRVSAVCSRSLSCTLLHPTVKSVLEDVRKRYNKVFSPNTDPLVSLSKECDGNLNISVSHIKLLRLCAN